MTARVACALFMDRVKRIVATRGAGRPVLDVSVSSEEVVVGWGCCLGLLIFGGPSHFRVINAFAVKHADSLARCLDTLVQIWNGDTGQQADDRHNYHDLDEGVSVLLFGFHGFFLVCGFLSSPG
jgi:hypothetical protein